MEYERDIARMEKTLHYLDERVTRVVGELHGRIDKVQESINTQYNELGRQMSTVTAKMDNVVETVRNREARRQEEQRALRAWRISLVAAILSMLATFIFKHVL